jgi:hypothetical protein
MFDKPKKVARSTQKFVSKHRVAIAVTLTAAVAVKLQMSTAKQFNEFLKEHNLFDEYYSMFEEV